MRAAQLISPRTFRLADVGPPSVGDDEVLLRVLACGVCGSDLNAWRGVPGVEPPLPFGAPGHEVWGEIEDPGSSGLSKGTLVTGLVQNGYAQLAVARSDELVAVPPSYGSQPLLGEPLACASNIARRSAVAEGQRVAVVGFGYLAAMVVQLLRAQGMGSWVAISRRRESRDLARTLGAESVYDFGEIPGQLWDSFPVVVEAAGTQQTLDFATWLTAYSGRLVIAGYHADGPRTVNLQSWNWKGIDVVNAHERDSGVYLQGMRAGLAALEAGQIELSSLISHRWPLERIEDALRTAEERPADYVKGLVMPWGD